MKTPVIVLLLALACGCSFVKPGQRANRAVALDEPPIPPGPYSTNWPPAFNPPVIDTNQLWLSAEQDSVNVYVKVNNANPAHEYYLWGSQELASWKLVDEFGGVTNLVVTISRAWIAAHNAPTLYFKTQDLNL
jgi:hypothetical protein